MLCNSLHKDETRETQVQVRKRYGEGLSGFPEVHTDLTAFHIFGIIAWRIVAITLCLICVPKFRFTKLSSEYQEFNKYDKLTSGRSFQNIEYLG